MDARETGRHENDHLHVMRSGYLSRRVVLRRAVAVGLSAPLIGGLLAACGGDDDEAPATGQQTAATGGQAAPTTAAGASTSGSASTTAPKQGGTLIFGMTQEPDNLDPHKTALAVTGRVLTQVLEPLLYKEKDGSFSPLLADSYEAKPDATEYSFKLRSGVKFHDGATFDAQAVKTTFDRIIDPATEARSAKASLGPYVESVIADPMSLTVKFSAPNAPFLDSAANSTLGILSPDAIAKNSAGIAEKPVGTGPFTFQEWVKKDHITLKRFADYAAPAIYRRTGPAYLDEAQFKFIVENGPRMATLETGETNFIEAVTAQDLPRFEKDTTKYQIYRAPIGGLVLGLMINATKAPTDDLAVRRAMLHAVDPTTIVNTLFSGVHTPADAPLSSAQFGYDPTAKEEYKVDTEEAKKILEQAGWKMSGSFRAKNGSPLQALMILQPGTKMEGSELLIQSQMREAGIDVQISERDRNSGYAAYSVGEHNIAPIFLYTSDPHALYLAFHSSQIGTGFNRTMYKDAALDKLLEDGAANSDPKKRQEIYGQAQHIILKQGIYIPIYNQVALYAARKEVTGVEFNHLTYPIFYNTSMS